MPILISSLSSLGPLTPIQIGVGALDAQALRAALRPVAPAVQVFALIDTGAEVTAVDSVLIQRLGVPMSGPILAHLPAHGGLQPAYEYTVSLTIIHPSGVSKDHLVFADLQVLELPLAPIGYDAILGRDVLAQCRFLYDGPAQRFELSC